MSFRISIEHASESFPCRADQTVLGAMAAAFRRSIQSGCRSGGCGVCKVRVLEGNYQTGQMSAAEVPAAERELGVVLACQLYPRSNLRLLALPRQLAVRSGIPFAGRDTAPLYAGFQP